MGDVLTTARTLGLNVITLEIRRAEDIAPAFDTLKGSADALYVCNDPLVNTNRIKAQNGHAARAVVCNAHDGLDMAATRLSACSPTVPMLDRMPKTIALKIGGLPR